jgi:hypothetical protein
LLDQLFAPDGKEALGNTRRRHKILNARIVLPQNAGQTHQKPDQTKPTKPAKPTKPVAHNAPSQAGQTNRALATEVIRTLADLEVARAELKTPPQPLLSLSQSSMANATNPDKPASKLATKSKSGSTKTVARHVLSKTELHELSDSTREYFNIKAETEALDAIWAQQAITTELRQSYQRLSQLISGFQYVAATRALTNIRNTASRHSKTKHKMSSPDYYQAVLVEAGLFSNDVQAVSFETSETEIGAIKPIGIGDLLLVEQTLTRYQAGEVSYIENVMKTESKSREFRTLESTETTTTSSTATTSTSSQDLSTATQYDMNSEVNKTIESTTSADAGVTVSASYGPVELGAEAGFAYSSSSSESSSSATTYAQEITSQTSQSLTEQFYEETVTKTLSEAEETNTHGFDNTAGDAHAIGIYQYVDKVYQEQVYNYGKRLMFEFLVPQPAAFYRYANTNTTADVDVPEPEELGSLTPDDLTESNYLTYAAKYNVTGLEQPPADEIIVGTAFEQTGSGEDIVSAKSVTSLNVPDGYEATYVWVNGTWFSYDDTNSTDLRLLVGLREFSMEADDDYTNSMNHETGAVPVSVRSYMGAYAITVEVRCARTDAAYSEWKQSVYDAIVAAYQSMKDEYDSAVTAANISALNISVQTDDTYRTRARGAQKGCTPCWPASTTKF